ncbi:hypothetical protein ILUMI_16524, partial [Ignelater luminosus]
MRCAAHTLQLAITDTLKEDTAATRLLCKIRQLVKKLRTPTYLYLIKKESLLKPALDYATRWNSTVDML